MHLPFNGISGLIVGVKTADRYETFHPSSPTHRTTCKAHQVPKTARGDLNAATAAPTLNTGPVANWTRSTDHSKHRNVASQFQWKKKKKEKKQKFSFSVFFFSRRANRPLASFDKFGPDRFSRTGRLLFHANHPHSVNFFIIFFFFGWKIVFLPTRVGRFQCQTWFPFLKCFLFLNSI